MADLSLAFSVLARDKASPTLNKIGDSAEKTGKRVHGAFGGMTGVVGKLGVALGGIAVVSAFKGFISEAEESRRVGRLTEAVIKSTGGAAKLTASQVGDLATAISNKTGVDDEAIQSGENLLLTFTNIRNETGKGNDIFSRATQTITDMSVALGQDTKSSAIQLGKALNDPIRGVTALRKVGVSFTAQQQKQIATLVKSGDTLGAQKVILAELGKEFGGAAEAAATPSQKLRVIFDNLKESIGTALLPVVDKLATFLGTKLIPWISKAGSFLQNLSVGGQKVSIAFKAFWGALREGDVTSDGMVGTFERVGDALHRLGGWIKSDALPALRAFGGFIAAEVIPRLKDLARFIATQVVPVFHKAFTFIATSVVPVLAEIGRFIVSEVVPALVKMYAQIAKNLAPAFASLSKFVQERVLPALAGLWARFKQVLPTLEAVTRVVLKVIGVILVLAAKILGVVIPVILRLAGPVFTALFAIIGQTIGIMAALARAVGTAFSGISKAATGMWDNVLRPTFHFITTAWFTVVGALVNGAAKAFGWVPGLGGKLKDAAAAFNRFRDEVNDALDGVKDRKVRVTATFTGFGRPNADNLGDGTRRAGGGPVLAGKGYWVGDGHGMRDAEWFQPGSSGYVSTQKQLAAAMPASTSPQTVIERVEYHAHEAGQMPEQSLTRAMSKLAYLLGS